MNEYIFPIHLTILALTAVGILLADHEAFLWLRGKKQALEYKKMFRLHLWVAFGLIGMIITGLTMFWPLHTFLINNSPAFLIKAAFVVVLVGNSFLIGELLKISTTRSFASLNSSEKMRVFLSGGVSTVSWLGAGIAALFLLK